ncbi:hypothetical protein EGR_01227 [Echinococcus granulosus]|uniref:Uncharacterized protein n=1 Tax=Echinococcus granulosus TaxID=6210 RepID=W6VBB8_ECHGR|nr:hypothetical protein EGR_01227 [Echinococcus granulosus]EUB64099.1 hypothetical protein EGR_01227 [Echinococcus granulosus]
MGCFVGLLGFGCINEVLDFPKSVVFRAVSEYRTPSSRFDSSAVDGVILAAPPVVALQLLPPQGSLVFKGFRNVSFN